MRGDFGVVLSFCVSLVEGNGGLLTHSRATHTKIIKNKETVETVMKPGWSSNVKTDRATRSESSTKISTSIACCPTESSRPPHTRHDCGHVGCDGARVLCQVGGACIVTHTHTHTLPLTRPSPHEFGPGSL